MKSLGIRRMFESKAFHANFPGAEDGVKLFKQNIKTDIDEKGTKVAVVTTSYAETVTSAGPPEIFNVNRPFLYLIWEKSTGAILLAGRFADPDLH